MNGMTIIDNESFKNLILKEKELEETKENLGLITIDRDNLFNELKEVREELRDLLLVITGGEYHVSYGEKKFRNYEINQENIAKFINENYLNDKGILIFRKTKEVEENENENND